ncbi:MAG: branched-chain amino acid ABC transporter permease [Acidimicrobiales bacterium]|jgi:branched-chain amino acid transport system permease protein
MRDDIGPMSLFLQRCFDSLANGSVYAGLAVALSMVFRSTGVLNLAQGQMATVSAYIAYLFASEPGPQTSFTNWVDDFGTPWPPWAAILVAVIISTFIGAGLERVVIRPLGTDDPLPTIGATLGLFLLLDAFVRKYWFSQQRFLGSPFPDGADDRFNIGGARLWFDTLGITLTMIGALAVLAFVQRRSKLGLAFRAVTSNRLGSELVGIKVGRVVMIGWGIAAGIGALGGGLIAGEINVRPDMMSRLLIFGLAAATLGGLKSPALAFAGGYLFAFTETMMAGYVGFIDSQVTLVWALGVVIVVLSIRPSGLLPAQSLTAK